MGLALVAALALVCLPARGRAYPTVARVTYYTDTGWTAGGTWTTPGRTAACSYDIPLWSTVWIGGDAYTCEDRGRLYPGPWVDVYDPTGSVPARYGDWAEIEVQ